MAGRLTLDQEIGVQVPVPQPVGQAVAVCGLLKQRDCAVTSGGLRLNLLPTNYGGALTFGELGRAVNPLLRLRGFNSLHHHLGANVIPFS